MKKMLCGRPGACCPTVELLPDGLTIEIEDDDGDTVQMTKSEFEMLKTVELKDL